MVNTDEVNVLTEEIKNMKAEMDSLKSTVNSLFDIKKEGKVIKKMIESLNEDIKDIKVQNKDIAEKIRLLEDEFDDSDTDESCDDESEALQFKCSKCNYRCERELTLSKHTNTKHSEEEHNKRKHEKKISTEASDKNQNESENEDEDELEYFQIEIVNDEEVYACNLCIEAFDSEKEVKEHLRDSHKKVIETDIEVSCSECYKDEDMKCIECIMKQYE